MAIGGYIRTALKTIIKWAHRDEIEHPEDAKALGSWIGSNPVSVSGSSIRDNSDGMHLTVFNATGGKVIELRTYDPRTDRSNTSLYVITDKEDLGEELGQIITKETLCR
jgi:hypothetical protein